MIRINGIKLPVDHGKDALQKAVIQKLKVKSDELITFEILRQSIDARSSRASHNHGEIYYQYSVAASVKNEGKLLKKNKNKDISAWERISYSFPQGTPKEGFVRPVIVGMGPAGLMCGLMLARAGLQPLLLERGCDVRKRTEIVSRFWETGELDPGCNVQFGEGGAGTFSDGKLNTLVKDPAKRHQKVLELFVEAGAPKEILYQQKPHIGTDLLTGIVENIRNQIIDLGGSVRFESEVTDIDVDSSGRIQAVYLGHERIEADHVVMALGHSARNTCEMLYDHHMTMTQKPFAIGVRIEHPQAMINASQYGSYADKMPAADYKLTHTCASGRHVYSFCMCPGGHVVNASSEPGMLAVNGMSYHKRDSANANSALIVNVVPEDFGSDHPLAGMHFQRKWERLAYEEGKGRVPVQLFADFKTGIVSVDFKEVKPVHKGAVCFGNIRNCLPDYVSESLCEGITAFGRRIQGYDRDDAILSGIETRTSSPLRMERDDGLESSIRGIYPCGEGAGYAGGITSAAMDGIRVAEAVAISYYGGQL